jgi:succinoglycan biosynthesis protein ExoA
VSTSAADAPEVTVVIPARNEATDIGPCLESVLSQSFDRMQVVVVDGASSDETVDVVTAFQARDARVELLQNHRAIIPVSLNQALAAARGRWLIRVDAHATVPTDYVATLVRHLESGRWGGVGGRKDGVGLTPQGKAVALAMSSPFGVGNSAYHYATSPQEVDHIPFGAYPVELARRLGGWDEQLVVNQDFEFDFRVREAGYKLLLDPALVVDWHCQQSISALFRQYLRYGRGKTNVARKHPGSVRARHLAAPMLLASWVAAILLALGGRRRTAAAVVVPYAVTLLGASTWTGRHAPNLAVARHLPGAFVAMHVGWALGFWRGIWGTGASARGQRR